MRALCAIGAIFAASAGLDREQAAALHLLTLPMLQMNGATPRDEIEERLIVELFQFREVHYGCATVSGTMEARKLKCAQRTHQGAE